MWRWTARFLLTFPLLHFWTFAWNFPDALPASQHSPANARSHTYSVSVWGSSRNRLWLCMSPCFPTTRDIAAKLQKSKPPPPKSYQTTVRKWWSEKSDWWRQECLRGGTQTNGDPGATVSSDGLGHKRMATKAQGKLDWWCGEVMMEEGEQSEKWTSTKKKKISTSPFFLSLPCLLMNEIKEGQSKAPGGVWGSTRSHLRGRWRNRHRWDSMSERFTWVIKVGLFLQPPGLHHSEWSYSEPCSSSSSSLHFVFSLFCSYWLQLMDPNVEHELFFDYLLMFAS